MPPPSPARAPITVALVDDYDVVVKGVANMLDPYRDRIVIAELDSTMPVEESSISFCTTHSPNPSPIMKRSGSWLPILGHAELWSTPGTFTPISSKAHGGTEPTGYLSKTLPARELVAALEAVHSGEVVISEVAARARSAPGLDWPGRGEGLSDREAEILALITQGKSNADIARLTYLSPNTVKSYIRTIYRKLGVGSRTQAVLWGVQHGFTPDHHRIEHWRGGP